MSEDDAPPVEPQRHDELKEENEQLRTKVHSLEIDKAVRDQMVQQMREDRKQLLGQLETHVQTMIEQGRTIGKLETRLALALPEAEPIDKTAGDSAAGQFGSQPIDTVEKADQNIAADGV